MMCCASNAGWADVLGFVLDQRVAPLESFPRSNTREFSAEQRNEFVAFPEL
jgi:hypothetical protein